MPPHRKARAERRETCRIVIETILSHLDLASLCLGMPTLENGFIDIGMQTIVRDSGIGQRRCERAIALLKEAGFMKVTQPRTINDQGDYVGLRAIRFVTTLFFEFLNLGSMLQRERARASSRLQHKCMKTNRKATDFMRRLTTGLCNSFGFKPQRSRADLKKREEETRRWNMTYAKHVITVPEPDECR